MVRGGSLRHDYDMTDNKKAFAELARGYSSVVVRLGDTALFWTSTCSSAPECRRIINHPTEIKELLHPLIGKDYRDRFKAFTTGESTYRCRDDVIADVGSRFGRSARTIETAISATLPSTAAK